MIEFRLTTKDLQNSLGTKKSDSDLQCYEKIK